MGDRTVTKDKTGKNNLKLSIERRETDKLVEASIFLDEIRNCRLHWGLSSTADGTWRLPPRSTWPEGSTAFSELAIQSPFEKQHSGHCITIGFDKGLNFSFMNFALYYPETDTWDNNHGKNYQIKLVELQAPATLPEDIFKNDIGQGKILFENHFDVEPEGAVSIAVIRDGSLFKAVLASSIQGELLLHWGAAINSPFEWRMPLDAMLPAGTVKYDEKAVQTVFRSSKNINRLTLQFDQKDAPIGISFVLRLKDEERWLNYKGQNFYIPVNELLQEGGYPGSQHLSHMAREIIKTETGHNSWTLMHRFNLCYNLLDRVAVEEEGLALIFVWLRYSFLRQLEWQRNYNTKPKELSHAQDRLTLKLAGIFINNPGSRDILRMIMSSLGRGGEGQRIRDDILRIMHRHHVKEVGGTFMEEWHQKLHNNTTPDDIVICEAYLDFLRSDGDQDIFYKTLGNGGVSKERLKSFERPIVTDPDFVPHIKDGLIYDFENYLKLLKSVHSGTDLDSAAGAAGYLLDYEMRGPLQTIFQHRDSNSVSLIKIAESISDLRRLLSERLNSDKDEKRVRDMIYLDLALEEYFRVVLERSIHLSTDSDQLVEILSFVIENEKLSFDSIELVECFRHWQRLMTIPRSGTQWSLHAKSILDRIARAVSDMSDRYYGLFQDKAVYLGKAFYAEEWIINIFSEEIVRGRLSFILSLLVRHLDPVLRKDAKLGDWQVISHGQATGVVEVVDSLRSVQGRSFHNPTIIIAEQVRGDEEPPEGVRAVITTDLVDLVAHVAIRARNSRLLFATCYDTDKFQHLKSLNGSMLSLVINQSGDLLVEKASEEPDKKISDMQTGLIKIASPEFSRYAISSREFNDNLVGGKSLNLVRLQDKLPEWILTPASVAIPFGVFEELLSQEINKNVADQYKTLVNRLEENPSEILSEIREIVIKLEPPGNLVSSLRIVMEEEGLGWSENWSDAWMCIKSVWASKWNERAYISRNSRLISHEDLFMAILIQRVVDAEYSFVIHTVNPVTSDENELYAEIVTGLGETLVGNYPGRALGFSFNKTTHELSLLSYPGKSIGLFGGGLIFRSDSNGEDLTEYAGAGLYDSVMLEPTRKVHLNYADEKLIWDDDFRRTIMSSIAGIGTTVEDALGSPQDIEGVYSRGKFYIVQTRPQV
jgi:alpha-glucan,water dikinase